MPSNCAACFCLFSFGTNTQVISILVQYNGKNQRPITRWKSHRGILPAKSTQLFCFCNTYLLNVLLSRYSLLMECPATTDKQSALFSRVTGNLIYWKWWMFCKTLQENTHCGATIVCACVCVSVLTLGQKSRYSFFPFILIYVFTPFIYFCRNCKYQPAEISLLQVPELIGHIAFLLESLPGSVTKATNPWLMIH